MKIETASLPLQLAYAQGNSTDAQFTPVLPLATEPGANALVDGVWPLPFTPGSIIDNQLFIMPFADAGPLTTFSMRLWGWNRGYVPFAANNAVTWIPFFICELLCVTCDCPGPGITSPAAPGPPQALPNTSNLCDTITLVQGDLGFYGRINSVGAAGTGQNMPAYVTVDLQGLQKFQLLFQGNDQNPSLGMNAFWCYK